jgi:hypothetical protein
VPSTARLIRERLPPAACLANHFHHQTIRPFDSARWPTARRGDHGIEVRYFGLDLRREFQAIESLHRMVLDSHVRLLVDRAHHDLHMPRRSGLNGDSLRRSPTVQRICIRPVCALLSRRTFRGQPLHLGGSLIITDGSNERGSWFRQMKRKSGFAKYGWRLIPASDKPLEFRRPCNHHGHKTPQWLALETLPERSGESRITQSPKSGLGPSSS